MLVGDIRRDKMAEYKQTYASLLRRNERKSDRKIQEHIGD
jgi:hypothetical protein